jgi:malate dehydrogenase (oxaloacetate-decarboxylating)
VSYPDREHIDDILQNINRRNVKVIVITDGERILGLGSGYWRDGDSNRKTFTLYRVWGISPAYTLPITIDVGTNNQQLLNDPLYMGWREPRITGEEYYDFIDQVLTGIRRRWPHALIQFEDFAQKNAMPLLKNTVINSAVLMMIFKVQLRYQWEV